MAWNDYIEGWKEPELLTDEEIELLLLDVSARIPFKLIAQMEVDWEDTPEYKPICHDFVVTAVDRRNGNLFWAGGSQLQEQGMDKGTMDVAPKNECFKPYLRSMDKMTHNEENRYEILIEELSLRPGKDSATNLTDWLNKHMFDYRGLIEKGLAIEAPEGMYNFE